MIILNVIFKPNQPLYASVVLFAYNLSTVEQRYKVPVVVQKFDFVVSASYNDFTIYFFYFHGEW